MTEEEKPTSAEAQKFLDELAGPAASSGGAHDCLVLPTALERVCKKFVNLPLFDSHDHGARLGQVTHAEIRTAGALTVVSIKAEIPWSTQLTSPNLQLEPQVGFSLGGLLTTMPDKRELRERAVRLFSRKDSQFLLSAIERHCRSSTGWPARGGAAGVRRCRIRCGSSSRG
jgi:hypothetical protein